MIRHRPSQSVRWSLLISGVVVGVVVTTTAVLVERPIAGQPVAVGGAAAAGGTGCDDSDRLVVVAPPVLTSVVRGAAERRCVTVDLRSVGGRAGVVESRADDVDVWITDSRLWALARGGVDPAAGVSVASSPVVMVVGTGMVEAAGGTSGVSWGLPLRRASLPGLTIGIQDPAATGVGLLVGQGVFTAARAAVPDEFTALSATAAGLQQPRILDAVRLGQVGPTELVFSAEYAAASGTGARVLRGREGEPSLDFPAFTVTADPARQAVAAGFVEELAGAALNDGRAEVYLRDPDGTARFSWFQSTAPLGPRMPMVDERTALRLFGLAQSGSVPGRNLVAVDVSGSMAARVASGETLMDVVRRSGLVALTALPDRSSVGLWEFASRLEGDRDHRVVVPLTQLAGGRPRLLQAVQQLRVVPDGATGLYDTVLAGYQELQNGYDPAAVQYLVVLTDGKNENDTGLDLAQLLDRLRAIQDPAKPISLIAVGYGDADIGLLQRIADVMGGSVYAVSSAEQIVGVLIDAIGRAHTS